MDATDIFTQRLFDKIDAAQKANQPLQTFWLSFAGDEGFRGVVIIDNCQSEAFLAASLAGANPHGEVSGIGFDLKDIPDDQRPAFMALPRLTLLSQAQLDHAGIRF